jgi:hypothetical protein
MKSSQFEILVEQPVLEAWGPLCTHDWDWVDYSILSIGAKYDINVVTADKNGQLLRTGGGRMSVMQSAEFEKPVPPPAALQPIVRDNTDGTYTISLQPGCLGEFSLLISMNGQPIHNGRIRFAVMDADPDQTSAAGAALTSAIAAAPAEFIVTTRTHAGEPVDLIDFRRSLRVPGRARRRSR